MASTDRSSARSPGGSRGADSDETADGGPPTATGAHAGDRAVRGQTLQDYLLGIGLFVITLGLVLAAFFGFAEPFATGVDGEDVSESERISETLVQNLSTGQPPNELHAADFQATLLESPGTLRARWGVADTTSFNVSLTSLNSSRVVERGGQTLAVGLNTQEDTVARTVRVVQLSDGSCDPACRLVVRVW